MDAPKTLQDAIVYFANPDNCVAFLVAQRWPDGDVVCPTCGRADAKYLPKRRVWQCKTRHPKCQFSVKVGTIFEDSPIGLDKWLMAMWMIANCKNGVSSWEIHRALGVTQKTAWFMMHRIRLTMQDDSSGNFGIAAPVEVDETFVGGKAKNMHSDKRKKRITRRGAHDKTIVFGILERGGSVKARVIPDRKGKTVGPILAQHVNAGSEIMTDEMTGYTKLHETYVHQVVNHAIEYVNGKVHTNGIENFWALLKRGLTGTYVSVEPFHLDAYLDEQVFRYNNRATRDNPLNDADRFAMTVSKVVGRRITYRELAGKLDEPRPF